MRFIDWLRKILGVSGNYRLWTETNGITPAG